MPAEGRSELVGAPARLLLDDLKPLQRSAQQLLDAGERARGDLAEAARQAAIPPKSLRPRLVAISPDSSASVALLRAAARFGRVLSEGGQAWSAAWTVSTRLEPVVAAARPARGAVRFFFTRGVRREAALENVRALQEWADWAQAGHADAAIRSATEHLGEALPSDADLWAAWEADPGEVTGALVHALGAEEASSWVGRVVSPPELALLTRLEYLANRAHESETRCSQAVTSAFEAARTAMVSRSLAEMPIETLREAADGRLRLGALRKAGYRSVGSVARARAETLESVDGVGGQTARQAVAAAGQIAAAVRADLQFRIDLDPGDAKSSQLVHELWRWSQVAVPFRHVRERFDSARASLEFVRDARAPQTGQVVALMPTSEAGTFDTWLPWCHERGSDLVAIETGLGAAQDVDASWADFSRRSADYYAWLAQIVGLDLESEPSQGYLPEQIVAAIREMRLDLSQVVVSLRGYQEFGAKLALVQRRVIIGDEMGLGKTVQALAVLGHLATHSGLHPLVVAPASVVVNWSREIHRHTKMRAHVAHGADADQATKSWRRYGGVLVTTYGRVKSLGLQPTERLSAVVVDEAHYVKNPGAKRSQAVRSLIDQTDHVLFLTGTPLENRLSEFESLVGYLDSRLFQSLDRATLAVGARRFKEAVAPVYLRRNIDDVLQELPELIETEEWLDLSPSDERSYLAAVRSGNFMAMRRAAYAQPVDRSAKLRRLSELVNEAVENGRKVVVFSYFRDVLDAVCAAVPVPTFGPLTGSSSPSQRQQMVDDFSHHAGGAVLVAQIQAGGVGMNIQAASVVILCEPQVKPSLESQAIARVRRMGQVRRVQVHRLLTLDSVDERMLEILGTKSTLFDEFARDSLVADAAPESVDVSERRLAEQVVRAEQDRLLDALAEQYDRVSDAPPSDSTTSVGAGPGDA